MKDKRAYLAISFSDRHTLDEEINYLVDKAKEMGVEVFVFVNQYSFNQNQEQEMMKTAFEEIDQSDFLFAELTEKSIGVGIEIGYAYSQNKPILYFRKKGSDYSTTAAGCADFIIEYKDKIELVEKVQTAIQKFQKSKIQ